MTSYKRIDRTEGIGLNKSKESIKCMICRYCYFRDIGFKYQAYICNGCHGFNMDIMNLSDIFILCVKSVDYRLYAANIDKKDAVSILNSSNLCDKGVI